MCSLVGDFQFLTQVALEKPTPLIPQQAQWQGKAPFALNSKKPGAGPCTYKQTLLLIAGGVK